MPHQTKLYVLTGFLGAGKTTVLLHLLEAVKGKKIGVIQNEFGKLSIDGEILRDGDVRMVELNRGSIFCSCLKLSFVSALAEMAKQELDVLFVESSGLGDPSNVEEILAATRALAGDAYDFRGAICLVDAVHFLDQLDDLETVHRQLKHCHLAVITKRDLVDDARVAELEQKIRAINPACRIEISAHGVLNLSFLEDDLLQYRWVEGEETTNSEETKPKTLTLWFDGTLAPAQLDAFLTALMPSLYRAKGFFCQTDGWKQIDLVGRVIDRKPCEPKPRSQLVLISRVGTAVIKQVFSAWEAVSDEKMELKN